MSNQLCKFRITYTLKEALEQSLANVLMQELDVLYWTNVDISTSYLEQDIIRIGNNNPDTVNVRQQQMEWAKKFADKYIDSVAGFVPSQKELFALTTTLFNNRYSMRMNNSTIRIGKEWWSGLSAEDQKIGVASVIEDWSVRKLDQEGHTLTLQDHFALRKHCRQPYLVTKEVTFFMGEEDSNYIFDLVQNDLAAFTHQIWGEYELNRTDEEGKVKEFVQEIWIYEITNEKAEEIALNSLRDIMDVDGFGGIDIKVDVQSQITYSYKESLAKMEVLMEEMMKNEL